MAWFRRPLRRNTRRGLIIVAFVMLALNLALTLFGDRFFWNGILLIFLFWFLLLRLERSTSLAVGMKRKDLDERQRSLRNQAYRLAYLVAFSLAALMLSLDFFGVGDFQILFYNAHSSVTSLLLYANFLLMGSLPIIYIAWLEPDPPRDESVLSSPTRA